MTLRERIEALRPIWAAGSGVPQAQAEFGARMYGNAIDDVLALLAAAPAPECQVLSQENVTAMAPAPETEQIEKLVVNALDTCENETEQSSNGLCDACALRLARAAYNTGVYEKNAAIRAAEERVAKDARQYWETHLKAALSRSREGETK